MKGWTKKHNFFDKILFGVRSSTDKESHITVPLFVKGKKKMITVQCQSLEKPMTEPIVGQKKLPFLRN